jgi:acyl-[acyl-carrier-protein] desaturase
MAAIARGETGKPALSGDIDPVLAEMSKVIAIDEAAHYNFFLEGARLYLYYFPAQAIEAMYDVITHFAMPAGHLIPDYDKFAEVVARAGIYGPREHSRDVVQHALNNLGFAGRKAVEAGIKRGRMVPDEDGNMRDSAIFEGIDFPSIADKVKRVFGRIRQHEDEVGFSDFDPTDFVQNYRNM